MPYFNELKSNLQSEYPYKWKLVKEKDALNEFDKNDSNLEFVTAVQRKTTTAQCQNIDLIIPSKMRTQKQQMQLDRFLNIIGSKLDLNSIKPYSHSDNKEIDIENNNSTKIFERNDEQRHFRIQEFIETEKSYVETLKTLVQYVVNPLKSNMQQKNCILNTFKCHKIFLNIDQILIVNQRFLYDLEQNNHSFGLVCKEHIKNFECYRKYLLEKSEAHKLHIREFKMNQVYKRFISKVNDQAEFKRKGLQDILVEPVQRISRYSLMLREILRLTPEEHCDFSGLKFACEKAEEIATMADDDQTRTATMFLNLYQSIKDSPCSLINQRRSLVAHLDAIEIHRATNKPTRAISLFLFTDKILVASRSCMDAKEIDINELLTTTNTTSSSLFPTIKNEKGLQFKGWSDIESTELFNGLNNNSFILSTNTVESSNITSFEKYFCKGPRLFSVKSDSLEKIKNFKDLYQKTRALVKQCELVETTFYKVWNGVATFSNLYSPENYMHAGYKNDTVLIYVENKDIDINYLFHNSAIKPWIVGLIQAQDMKGFRFHTRTRTQFPRFTTMKRPIELTIDFESIFWNNLIILDQRKRKSNDFTGQPHQQQEISRSVSRTSSVPSIEDKSFHDGADGSQFKVRDNNNTTPAISTGSSVSSSSMIEEDDEGQEDIDYLTIKC